MGGKGRGRARRGLGEQGRVCVEASLVRCLRWSIKHNTGSKLGPGGREEGGQLVPD